MAKKRKWTADEVRRCIAKRFDAAGNGAGEKSIVLHEMATATGFSRRMGWIDTCVFEMWPSRGWTRRAIEIKVSRADFLHELKQPKKSEWARKHFHEFWFCSPPDIIKPAEVPEGSGLYHTNGDSVVTKVAARRQESPSCSDEFVASLIRSASRRIKSEHLRAQKRALEDSDEYKDKLAVYNAVSKFFKLKSRGFDIIGMDEDRLFEELCKVTAGTDAKKQSGKVNLQLSRFRNMMNELVQVMVPLAYLGILETDKVGEEYFASFGLKDKEKSWLEIAERWRKGHKKVDMAVLRVVAGLCESAGVEVEK